MRRELSRLCAAAAASGWLLPGALMVPSCCDRGRPWSLALLPPPDGTASVAAWPAGRRGMHCCHRVPTYCSCCRRRSHLTSPHPALRLPLPPLLQQERAAPGHSVQKRGGPPTLPNHWPAQVGGVGWRRQPGAAGSWAGAPVRAGDTRGRPSLAGSARLPATPNPAQRPSQRTLGLTLPLLPARPAAPACSQGARVEVNFGRQLFQYDWAALVAREQAAQQEALHR